MSAPIPSSMPPRWLWLLVNFVVLSVLTAMSLTLFYYAYVWLDREPPPVEWLSISGVTFIMGFMFGMDAVWGQRERERLKYFAKRLRRCAMVEGYAEESLSKFDCAELANLIEGR